MTRRPCGAPVFENVKRLVVPVGRHERAGILTGCTGTAAAEIPVLGVVVRSRSTRRLDKYATVWSGDRCAPFPAGVD